MLRNVLVIGQIPPPVHGSNVMTERFVRTLEELGERVCLVQKAFSRRQEDVGQVSAAKFAKIPFIAAKLVKYLLKAKPDLCFYFISARLPSFYVDAVFLWLVRLLGVDYVICFHGKGFDGMYQNSRLLTRSAISRTISCALGGMVVGEGLKTDVCRFIARKRLFVLPNAIPDVAGRDKKRLDVPKKDVQVLFLSNLVRAKGPLEVLKMARRVHARFENTRFVIAGPARSKGFHGELLDYVKKWKMSDYVSFVGGVYGQKKENVFRESDIFVFPSHEELFGLVNLEAMQRELPVVSSKEGAIPEVVRHGINGFNSEPWEIDRMADYVGRLVEDETLRKEMGQAGREIYETEFTLEAYKESLKNALVFFFDLKRA